jgi:clathrin heavy chain
VANIEIYYRALSFYLEQHPLLLTDLLTVLAARIDHARVVRLFARKDNDNLPLIRGYLISVQHHNIEQVSTGDSQRRPFWKLTTLPHRSMTLSRTCSSRRRTSRRSVPRSTATTTSTRSRWPSVWSATSCSSSDGWRPTFTRPARAGRSLCVGSGPLAARLLLTPAPQIDLSKNDKLWRDAIETAAVSGETEVAEGLLSYFVDIGMKEAVSAVLFACYDVSRRRAAVERT